VAGTRASLWSPKLGIKPDARIAILHAPRATSARSVGFRGQAQCGHGRPTRLHTVFTSEKATARAPNSPPWRGRSRPPAMLWISWPKRSSGWQPTSRGRDPGDRARVWPRGREGRRRGRRVVRAQIRAAAQGPIANGPGMIAGAVFALPEPVRGTLRAKCTPAW